MDTKSNARVLRESIKKIRRDTTKNFYEYLSEEDREKLSKEGIQRYIDWFCSRSRDEIWNEIRDPMMDGVILFWEHEDVTFEDISILTNLALTIY